MNPAMLALLGARGAAPSGGPFAASYIGYADSTDDAAQYTLPAVPMGAASPSRTIIAVVMARSGAYNHGAYNLTGLTIGGQTASIDHHNTIYGAGGPLAICRATLPSGTAADVVATFAGPQSGVGVLIYSVPALVGLHATGVESVGTIPGGIIIAAANIRHTDLGQVPTWTGVVGDAHGWYGGVVLGAVAHADAAPGGSVSIGFSIGTTYYLTRIAASYQEA